MAVEQALGHLTISLDVSEENPVDGLHLREECPLVDLHQVLEREHVCTVPEMRVGLQLRTDGQGQLSWGGGRQNTTNHCRVTRDNGIIGNCWTELLL